MVLFLVWVESFYSSLGCSNVDFTFFFFFAGDCFCLTNPRMRSVSCLIQLSFNGSGSRLMERVFFFFFFLRDHPIVLVSEGFTRVTGYEKQQIVGRNCRFLQVRLLSLLLFFTNLYQEACFSSLTLISFTGTWYSPSECATNPRWIELCRCPSKLGFDPDAKIDLVLVVMMNRVKDAQNSY